MLTEKNNRMVIKQNTFENCCSPHNFSRGQGELALIVIARDFAP